MVTVNNYGLRCGNCASTLEPRKHDTQSKEVSLPVLPPAGSTEMLLNDVSRKQYSIEPGAPPNTEKHDTIVKQHVVPNPLEENLRCKTQNTVSGADEIRVSK